MEWHLDFHQGSAKDTSPESSGKYLYCPLTLSHLWFRYYNILKPLLELSNAGLHLLQLFRAVHNQDTTNSNR